MFERLFGTKEKDPAIAARIPPGQYKTDKFPVLHYGSVPHTDLATWDFKVWGEVDSPFTLTWEQFKGLPRKTVNTDIHCVTRWTKLDTTWEGVPIQTILEMAAVRPNATHVVSHAEQGYTANVPLSVLDDDDVLLADTFGGEPLELEHGYPLRLLIPKRYFWKSSKWVRGLAVPRPRPARLLGALRLQQRRRSVEGRAFQRMTDAVAQSAATLPAIYLGHGAPPLLEDAEWMGELGDWGAALPRPTSILIVSAHWQTAPIALSSTRQVPLVYDFYGFPQHYYEMTYDSPGAPDLAAKVRGLMPANEPVLERETRGLDHGAWVPLKAMYPDADIPVLQMSMPDLDPQHLFDIGRRLAPLRDEGVLIVGSGFLTHGLPFVHEYFLGKPGRAAMVDRLRPVGGRSPRPRRHRRAVRLPREGARDALRAPDGRALRAALRHPRRRRQARRRPRLHDRGLLLRPLEALLRGALTRRASCGGRRGAGADRARRAATGRPAGAIRGRGA